MAEEATLPPLFGANLQSGVTLPPLFGEETREVETSAVGKPGFVGEFTGGIGRGWEDLKGTIMELAPALALQIAGDEEGAKKKLEQYRKRIEDYEKTNPTTPVTAMLDSPESFARGTAALLGESIPTIASILIPGGLATKAITKVAPRLLVQDAAGRMVAGKSAQALGLGAAGTALGVPQSFERTEVDTREMRPEVAAVAGTLQGALNAIPGFTILQRMHGTPFANAVVTRILAEAGFQGAVGAGAGAASAGVQELATNFVDENRGDVNKVLYGALAGAVQGAGFGGVMGVRKGPPPAEPTPEAPPPEAPMPGLKSLPYIQDSRERHQFGNATMGLTAADIARRASRGPDVPMPEDITARLNAEGDAYQDAADWRRTYVNEQRLATQADAEEQLASELPAAKADREARASDFTVWPEQELTELPNDGLIGSRGPAIPPIGLDPIVAQRLADQRATEATRPSTQARSISEVLTKLTSEDVGGLGLRPGDLVRPEDIKQVTGIKSNAVVRMMLEDLKKEKILVVKNGKAYIPEEPEAPKPPSQRELAQERTLQLFREARKATLGDPKELVTPEVTRTVHDTLVKELPLGEKITPKTIKYRWPEFDPEKVLDSLRRDELINEKNELRSRVAADSWQTIKAAKDVRARPTNEGVEAPQGKLSSPLEIPPSPRDVETNNVRFRAASDEVQKAADPILDVIAPQAIKLPVEALEMKVDDTWYGAHGTFFNTEVGGDLRPVIAYSIGNPAEVAATKKHEAIHYLKRSKLLNEKEWDTLEQAAVEGDWLNKHWKDTPELFEKVSPAGRLEEAVAEEFAMWRSSGYLSKIPEAARPIFEKMDLFFRNMAAKVRKLFGRDATPNDIFTAIMRGEVGRRTPADSHGYITGEVTLPKARLIVNDVLKRHPDNPQRLGKLEAIFSHADNIANRYPLFTEYYRGLEEWIHSASSIRSDYHTKMGKVVEGLGDKDRAQVMRFAEAQEYLVDGNGKAMLPKPKGDGSYEVVVPREAKTTLSNPGDRVTLTPELGKRFDMFMQNIRELDEIVKKSLKSRYELKGDMTVKSLRDQAKLEATSQRRNIYNNIADRVAQLNSKPNYIPHIRIGDFSLVVRDAQGNNVYQKPFDLAGTPGSTVRNVALKYNEAKIAVAEAKLRERYSPKEGYTIQRLNMTYDEFKRIIGDPITDLRLAGDLLIGGMGKEANEFFVELDSKIKGKGLRANFLPRKNIPGWVDQENAHDYLSRAGSVYVTRVSNFAGRNFGATQMFRGMRNMEIGATINGVKFEPDMSLLKYAHDQQEYLNSGMMEAQGMRNLAWGWFMGLNLAPAALNITQTLHSTFPYLSMITGNSFKSGMAAAGGMKDALRLLREIRPIQHGLKGDIASTILNMKKPEWFRSQAEWDVIHELMKTGEAAPMVTFENAGLIGGEGAVFTGFRRKYEDLIHRASALFQFTEVANRIGAGLATIRLAQDPKVFAEMSRRLEGEQLWAQSDKSIQTLASHVIGRTQFNMTRGTKPIFMRGPARAVVTQFMSYPVRMIELAWDMVGRHGGEGRKAFGLMALGMLATSGFWSMPLMDNAKDLTEFIYKFATSKGLDLDQLMVHNLAEIGATPDITQMVMRGVIPHLTGASLAQRAGVGKLIDPGMFSGNLDDMMGPSGGMMAGSISDAVHYHKQGRDLMAIASLLPSVMKNVLKGVNATEEGFRTRSGATMIKPEEVDFGQVFTQALGFQPEEVGRRSQLMYSKQRLATDMRDLTTEFHNRLGDARADQAAAMRSGDKDAMTKAKQEFANVLKEIKDYNEGKDPEDRVVLNGSAINRRVQQRLLPLAQQLRGVRTQSREAARRMAEERGIE